MDGHNGGMAIMVAIMLATMVEWNRETPIWGGGEAFYYYTMTLDKEACQQCQTCSNSVCGKIRALEI